MLSWTALRQGTPGFLLLRYEDMKRDPATVLAGVAAFLEGCSFRALDARPEALERTIELSSQKGYAHWKSRKRANGF